MAKEEKKPKKRKSSKPKKGTAYIDGAYYVWPSGKKTHIRYIYEAVTKGRNLPKGLFALSDKLPKYHNLARIVAAARKRGLKDNVVEGNS